MNFMKDGTMENNPNLKSEKISLRVKKSTRLSLQWEALQREIKFSDHINDLLECHLSGCDTSGEAERLSSTWTNKYNESSNELVQAKKYLKVAEQERDLVLANYQNNLKNATNLAYQKGFNDGQNKK